MQSRQTNAAVYKAYVSIVNMLSIWLYDAARLLGVSSALGSPSGNRARILLLPDTRVMRLSCADLAAQHCMSLYYTTQPRRNSIAMLHIVNIVEWHA